MLPSYFLIRREWVWSSRGHVDKRCAEARIGIPHSHGDGS
jgi:hypothetical protein